MGESLIEQVKQRLKSFISYEEGVKLKEQLAAEAKSKYIPKNSEGEYFRYMNEHECVFSKNNPQSVNHPYVWTMFSVPSQHVQGNCVEECLDKAIEYEKGKERITGFMFHGDGTFSILTTKYEKRNKK